jgi:hypothetical protein
MGLGRLKSGLLNTTDYGFCGFRDLVQLWLSYPQKALKCIDRLNKLRMTPKVGPSLGWSSSIPQGQGWWSLACPLCFLHHDHFKYGFLTLLPQ